MKWLKKLDTSYFLSLKTIYLTVALQHYVLYQFRSVFAENVFHIKKQDLGYYFGFLYFITFFTNVLIAAVTDRYNRYKATILAAIVVSSASFQLFFLPAVQHCGKPGFWGVMCTYLIFNSAVPSLVDSVVLDRCGAFYGTQRIFDSLGYILSIAFVEAIIMHKGRWDFVRMQWYHVAVASAAFVACALLVRGMSSGRKKTQLVLSTSLFSASYCFFLLIILLNGIVRGNMSIYLPVFYKNILGLDSPKKGLPFPVSFLNRKPFTACTIAGTVGEIIVFFFTNRIIELLGLYWPILLGMVAQLLRVVLYLTINWQSQNVFLYVFLIEMLKGFCFGLVHSCGSRLAGEMCPPDLKFTSQMIYNGTYAALGSLIGGILGGAVFGEVDAEREFTMFYKVNICVIVSAIALLFFKQCVLGGSLLAARRRTSTR